MLTRALISDFKKTVVFLGRSTEKGTQFSATGFLVRIQNIFHLVTAKHVVINPENDNFIDGGMLVYFNLKNGTIGSHPIDGIKEHFSVSWIFHKNKDVDIALIPFGLDAENDDVKTISDHMFLTGDRLCEIYDVFFLSYQPGIQSRERISPVIRSGTISLINDDKTFFIDAFAFPGNSGSPVFLKPSPIRFDEGSIAIGGDPIGGKFIGVIGAYLPYQEIAISSQTGRPRVVFEENTGLARVWSYSFIKEITELDVFQQQISKMTQLFPIK